MMITTTSTTFIVRSFPEIFRRLSSWSGRVVLESPEGRRPDVPLPVVRNRVVRLAHRMYLPNLARLPYSVESVSNSPGLSPQCLIRASSRSTD